MPVRASVDGLDVVRDRYAVRRVIGVLSDARGLYPRLTARENIRYFGALHGIAPARARRRASMRCSHTLGLTAIADRRAQGFSQGEKMKVAIARALVHDPTTILLDEPTNGLDIMSVRALRDQLRALRAAGKCLLLLVARDAGSGRAVRPHRHPRPRPRRRAGTAAELVAQAGAAIARGCVRRAARHRRRAGGMTAGADMRAEPHPRRRAQGDRSTRRATAARCW